MLRKLTNKIYHNQKGITGLETAIILIAFVVVASVFAYTVLSAGIFSAEKGKEAVYSGLDQARSSLTFKGSVVGMGAGNVLTSVVFTVGNALEGEAIDMTPTAGNNNVTVISYQDKSQRVENLPWTVIKLGNSDDDNLLEPGEKFEITVNVTSLNPDIAPYTTFNIEVRPPKGSVLNIETTIPAVIDAVNILN